MCQACGCSLKADVAREGLEQQRGRNTVIEVMQDLLAANDRVAVHNREHFTNTGYSPSISCLPGCGQNGVLEATIPRSATAIASPSSRATWKPTMMPCASARSECRHCRSRQEPPVTSMRSWCIARCTICRFPARSAVHRKRGQSGVSCQLRSWPASQRHPAQRHGRRRQARKIPVMFRASDLVVLSKADLLGVLDDFDPSAQPRHCARSPRYPLIKRRLGASRRLPPG